MQETIGWAVAHTLGSKEKLFKWSIDNDNLTVLRIIGSKENRLSVAFENLDQIHSYVSNNNWTHLANSVSKISNGTEKYGIGRFIYEYLNLSVSEAQLASHIAALFCQAGIWESNGVVKGMMFRKIKDDWKTALIKWFIKNKN